MYIKSELTGQRVYYIGRNESGWYWELLWRYAESTGGFSSQAEAIAGAKRHYAELRERTGTGVRRKVYHI